MLARCVSETATKLCDKQSTPVGLIIMIIIIVVIVYVCTKWWNK